MTSVNAQMVFQCLAVIDFHGNEVPKFLAREQVTGQDNDWPWHAVRSERSEETFVSYLSLRAANQPTQQLLGVSEPLDWLFLCFLLAK